MIHVLAAPAFSNRRHNPYNSLLYEPMAAMDVTVEEYSRRRLLSSRPDIWHLHWPEAMFSCRSSVRAGLRMGLMLSMLALARLKGVKICWTMHNLAAHERRHLWLERLFWPLFTRCLDGYFSLSEAARQAALARFAALRNLPGRVVLHGHYRGVYADEVTREQARQQLGIPPDAAMLLYLGLIRPYKNVPHLIRTFQGWNMPGAVLCVAGNPNSPELAGEVAAAAAADRRVRTVLEFVPDRDVQLYLRAADMAVFPFSEIFNSGSAILALSFDCPVLIPRQGSMLELQERVGADWVHTYDGQLTVEILDHAWRWTLGTCRPSRAPLDQLDWRELAAQTVAVYREICHPGPRGETTP